MERGEKEQKVEFDNRTRERTERTFSFKWFVNLVSLAQEK